MNPDFNPRLLAAEDSAGRQAEVAGHRPRLQPSGMPLVFIEADAACGLPARICAVAENGALMRIGRVVAIRIGRTLRVDDLCLFDDVDLALYLPAVLDYLEIEAGLFGLERVQLPGDGSAPPSDAA